MPGSKLTSVSASRRWLGELRALWSNVLEMTRKDDIAHDDVRKSRAGRSVLYIGGNISFHSVVTAFLSVWDIRYAQSVRERKQSRQCVNSSSM